MSSKPPHLKSPQSLTVTWSDMGWEIGISLRRLNTKSLNRITVKSLNRGRKSSNHEMRPSIQRFTIQRSVAFRRLKSFRSQKTAI